MFYGSTNIFNLCDHLARFSPRESPLKLNSLHGVLYIKVWFLSTIDILRKIPVMTAQMTLVPMIAPVRVASMTSPEPTNSDAHITDGPTKRKIAKPFGGRLIFMRQN